jgi:hypothetical protein
METVRRRLRDAGSAECSDGLEWALQTVIADLVTHRLAALRGFDRPLADPSPEAELRLIADDFRSGNVHLQAWSGLYYRFLCPSVYLRVGELTRLALGRANGRSGERLLERRIQRGVQELTAMLRDVERETVQRKRGPAMDRTSRTAVPMRSGRPAHGGGVGHRPETSACRA